MKKHSNVIDFEAVLDERHRRAVDELEEKLYSMAINEAAQRGNLGLDELA
jgi:hypothetical protein